MASSLAKRYYPRRNLVRIARGALIISMNHPLDIHAYCLYLDGPVPAARRATSQYSSTFTICMREYRGVYMLLGCAFHPTPIILSGCSILGNWDIAVRWSNWFSANPSQFHGCPTEPLQTEAHCSVKSSSRGQVA